MKLKNQVVSLELAKQLKKLKVSQESLFYWWTLEDIAGRNRDWFLSYQDDDYSGAKNCQCVSAFTCSELGVKLVKSGYQLPVWSKRENWYCPINGWDRMSSNTEVDCRAKMLIYLLENNLISIKKQEK